jgi:hypothetical protein
LYLVLSAFRPYNSHCIFIDAKADAKVFKAVEAIVRCYREIFLQVGRPRSLIRNL